MTVPVAHWSKSLGTQYHLDGLKRGFQVTVSDRGSFAELLVFTPGNGFNAQASSHPTVQDAMDAGQSAALSMNAFEQVAA